MRKCTGNNTHEWGPEAIFDVPCEQCGTEVEFFKDEITRNCPKCHGTVKKNRDDYGCNQWCSSSSEYVRNRCPNFRRSKARHYWFYF